MELTTKKGFTLAEVLITLAIIGVVAALTIPMAITKYQKQITVNKLKKSYNNLSNVIQMAVNDNGDMLTWDVPPAGSLLHADSDFYKKYFEPYIKSINKNYSNHSNIYSNKINDINGNNIFQGSSWQILPDGTGISLFNGGFPNGYFWIFVDINGPKLPNRLGKDIFMLSFDVNKSSLIFLKGYGCSKTGVGGYAGGGCGNKIMSDGWKISDDYPW